MESKSKQKRLPLLGISFSVLAFLQIGILGGSASAEIVLPIMAIGLVLSVISVIKRNRGLLSWIALVVSVAITSFIFITG